MATVPVTILPYMGEGRGNHFDRHQFIKGARAVKARYTPEGWQTTGIDYDYLRSGPHKRIGGNIHVEHRQAAYPRRKPTRHEWAMNDDSLQKVVLQYCEERLYLRGGDQLSNAQRLDRIAKQSKAILPDKEQRLRDAMNQYNLAEQSHAHKKELRRRQILVQNFDSEIKILRRGIAMLAANVVVHSYRLGEVSTTVAEQLGLLPPMVRIWLYRMNRMAEGLPLSCRRSQKYKHLPRRGEKPRWTPERVKQPWRKWDADRLQLFRDLRASGLSFNQCAKRLGTATSYAIKVWRKNFGDLRPKSRPLDFEARRAAAR